QRTKKFLHKISKQIVDKARQNKSAIVFENLKGIRKLYRKGNGQGNNYRRRLNGWPHYELQRQVEYKAAWEGVPVLFEDPKCTSKLCPVCGKRIQEDRQNRRKLWCDNCMKSMVTHPRGNTNEACGVDNIKARMQEPKISNYDSLAILIVDVSKGESWK
ncbi:MAG: putative transposase, OrfB family, partial [Candidatus Nitrosotenuis sp.]|nr:putative transposase, OrfB family [Candidatus Nitrosotenuis sp.]